MANKEVIPGYSVDKYGLYRSDEYGKWRPIEIEQGHIVVQKLRALTKPTLLPNPYPSVIKKSP